jgi:hypothetical protein
LKRGRRRDGAEESAGSVPGKRGPIPEAPEPDESDAEPS